MELSTETLGLGLGLRLLPRWLLSPPSPRSSATPSRDGEAGARRCDGRRSGQGPPELLFPGPGDGVRVRVLLVHPRRHVGVGRLPLPAHRRPRPAAAAARGAERPVALSRAFSLSSHLGTARFDCALRSACACLLCRRSLLLSGICTSVPLMALFLFLPRWGILDLYVSLRPPRLPSFRPPLIHLLTGPRVCVSCPQNARACFAGR